MDLTTAVERTVESTAETLFQPRGWLKTRPNIDVRGVSVLWSPAAPENDYLENYWAGSEPANNLAAIVRGTISWYTNDTLRTCWKTGQDTEQELAGGLLFTKARAIAIERNGVVVSITATHRSRQELREIAEDYCRKVLTLTDRLLEV